MGACGIGARLRLEPPCRFFRPVVLILFVAVFDSMGVARVPSVCSGSSPDAGQARSGRPGTSSTLTQATTRRGSRSSGPRQPAPQSTRAACLHPVMKARRRHGGRRRRRDQRVGNSDELRGRRRRGCLFLRSAGVLVRQIRKACARRVQWG